MGDVKLLDRVRAETAMQKSDMGLTPDEKISTRPGSYQAWTREGATD
jgi:hypothetical protein